MAAASGTRRDLLKMLVQAEALAAAERKEKEGLAADMKGTDVMRFEAEQAARAQVQDQSAALIAVVDASFM